MHPLYPFIKPYKCHELKVSKPHILYVEETGNPEGLAVIVLHSGPGAGGDTHLRRFFDPETYRIINFDQRGCGRSLPHAELTNNTTQHLLTDIDAIREFLGLNKVIIAGGGFGALLALLYAENSPHHVHSLLLYQLFLGRAKDIAWLYHQGANEIYPDYWQEFINIVPTGKDIVEYYYQCLQGNNDLARMAAAKNWALWQARCSSLQTHANLIEEYQEPHFALALAALGSYYTHNNYFIEDNQILANTHKIRHLPTYLIHGRYDMICPLAGAWELSQSLSAANLSIVRDAGHSIYEAGIIDAIITASLQIAQHAPDAG